MALAKTGMIEPLSNWLSSISSNELRGGLALPRKKPGLNVDKDIKSLSLANTICIPLLNYQQEVLEPLVSVGQPVCPADLLAPGIIATCFGVITSIESRAVNHPSGTHALCVMISPDTEKSNDTAVFSAQNNLTAERLSACAIQGLGGAGFKTANKIKAISASEHGSVDTLIINAVECEPLISCDESLIVSQASDIVVAIEGLIDFTQCHRCLFAIENDKTAAIEQLKLAIQTYPRSIRFEIVYLAPVYPAGAERTLVERLTGAQTPGHIFPANLGILCINVATALATEHARLGKAMVSRIVTIAGELCDNPTNVRVTFGTSVYDVIEQTGNLSRIDNASIRIGGPLSGYLINDLSVPITATTNCITLERSKKSEQIYPCIRCGACSDVCPVDLLPQQLHSYSINENTDKAQALRLSECIECACCDIVCPSNIPLTQTFRFAKGLIREQNRQSLLATQAESRYQKRESRIADRVEKRALKREAARTKLATDEDPIASALARARKRRKKATDD